MDGRKGDSSGRRRRGRMKNISVEEVKETIRNLKRKRRRDKTKFRMKRGFTERNNWQKS